ncbi:MAG: conjugal transfer protein TraG N-terminal domain-containing protein [Gammaproteobacteria bacterium]|nr:conjugal transfer protein TraG N-terminal domain-containing protein [Gammaproteobacteria bacterium]
MDFEIYTYGGGEFLRLVFNGVAALLASDDFIGAIKTALLIGLLALLTQSAFKGTLLNWPSFFISLMAYFVMLVPRADVIVVDRIDETQTAVVENVPIGIAFPASLTNHVGDWLTRAFDSLYSLPDDLTYTRTGMLFGNRLLEAARRFEITDERTNMNMSEFWRQCVFYDILYGKYDMGILAAQQDLWGYIQANTSPVRAFSYRYADGHTDVLVCQAAAQSGGALDADLDAAVTQARQFYGRTFSPYGDDANAIALFSAAFETSVQWLTTVSDTAQNLVRQAALTNSLRRGMANWAASVDASAAMQDYALAKAEAERRTTFQTMGDLAARVLPIIRNLFEAFIYAVFPIVMLAMMLPVAAKVAAAYAKALIWIVLWSPLYSILHGAMSYYSRYYGESLGQLPDGTIAYSLGNVSALGALMADHAALAGYLSLSIPMIAWLFVSLSGAVMATLAQRVMSSYEAPVSKGAAEATSGNMALGNVSFDNTSMWQNNRAPSEAFGSIRETGPDGWTRTITPGGTYSTQPLSNLAVGVDIQSSIGSALRTQASKEIQSAQAEMASFAENSSATLERMNAINHQMQSTRGYSENQEHADTASLQKSLDSVNAITDRFAQDHGLSREQASKVLGAAWLSASTPGIVDLVSPVDLQAQLRIDGHSSAKFAETFKAAVDYARDMRYGERYQQAVEAGTRLTATDSDQLTNAEQSGLRAAIGDTSLAQHSASASLQQAERYQNAIERVESRDAEVSMRLNDDFLHYVEDEYRMPRYAVEGLLTSANLGDPAAQASLRLYLQDYAETHAAKLAEVLAAPSASEAVANGDAAIGRMRTENSARAARAAQEALGETAAGAGVSEQAIEDRRRHLEERIEADRALANAGVEQGGVLVRQDGDERREQVDRGTDSPALLGQALDGAGRVLPNTDRFSDLLPDSKPKDRTP